MTPHETIARETVVGWLTNRHISLECVGVKDREDLEVRVVKALDSVYQDGRDGR